LLVSIIIPSFNTKKLLQNCLRSIFEQTKNISFEVIVADNASTDGTVKLIQTKFPQVKLIKNRTNLGYAKANNQALRQAQGRVILFLNSDTIILEKAIEKSVEFIRQREDVDILGCQLLYQDKTIQPSGGFFPSLTRVFLQMFFIDDLPLVNHLVKPYQQKRKSFYRKTQKLDWVTGAFLMAKKKVVDKIKGFDEKFFMYSEEVDFCYRAKKAGFQVWFCPLAKIVHLKGKSSADGFRTAVLGEYQGLRKFYEKYQPGLGLLILRFLLKIGALLRIFVFGILKGDKNKKEIYEKAFALA